MDLELCKRYVDIKRNGTLEEKIAIMMECMELEDEEMLCRDARYDLAQLFLTGEGVDKDREQAIELLMSSADMGSIRAMEQVGALLIEDGIVEEGNAYLQKAKDNKLSDAELNQTVKNIQRALNRIRGI